MCTALASLTTLLFLTNAMAQLPPVTPEMRWMLGDQRRVETTCTIRVQPNDSTKLSTNGHAVLNLKVADVKKDMFVLSASTTETDLLDRDKAFFALPDSVLNKMQKAPAGVYAPLMGKATLYGVDRKGKYTSVQEAEAMRSRVHDDLMDGALDMLAQDQQQNKRSPAELDATVNKIIDSLSKAFTQVQLNTVNDVLAVFNHPLPAEGSERKPFTWKGLFIPGLGIMPELAATEESGCDKVDTKELVVRVVTTCDADALLKVMNQRTAPKPGMDPAKIQPPLKKNDVSLVKESVYTFDRSTGWLTNATHELRFRAGTMSVRSNARSVLTPVRQ